ncbi:MULTISPECIES: flagellar basal body rod protein FlgB [unclassified Geobacillus]|uniref:flagellar basal body rod protein FlgB n=1 Tax=unclassified Geobacillus TaxID=2642459 RepID=UPI0007ABD6C3|nr:MULTISPECIES: flagellar basal body rod protein FlgB [unclassified Geobacillus]KZE96290.1 Flagellar basal body rod protein FlgB [Geobacillus stearothermophilus]NNU98096.1 flagellar basal body rod protein FlgB [Geobacillus sp. DSP4a]PJW18989.1 flagellar basal body rod protein FlgB [Geobacillus sp. WSUCF-018B]
MALFSATIGWLEQGLRYAALRQQAIADNIANADTPGYKAKDVRFQAELDRALALETKRTDPRHFPFRNEQNGKIVVTTNASISYNHNGNSVDIDQEMSKLAENQIYYNALIERLNGKFNTLKTVIKGGK